MGTKTESAKTYTKLKFSSPQAEADLTQAIACDPRFADAYAQRCFVRVMQGRANEAQQDFDQCLSLNPKLRQSVDQMIEEAKRQMAAKR